MRLMNELNDLNKLSELNEQNKINDLLNIGDRILMNQEQTSGIKYPVSGIGYQLSRRIKSKIKIS